MEMEDNRLQSMQNYVSVLRSGGITVPRSGKFTRSDVVNAFSNSFELIGGVSRLALWAHENEGEFYKLYSKLLPSASIIDLNVRVSNELSAIPSEELERIIQEEDNATEQS